MLQSWGTSAMICQNNVELLLDTVNDYEATFTSESRRRSLAPLEDGRIIAEDEDAPEDDEDDEDDDDVADDDDEDDVDDLDEDDEDFDDEWDEEGDEEDEDEEDKHDDDDSPEDS